MEKLKKENLNKLMRNTYIKSINLFSLIKNDNIFKILNLAEKNNFNIWKTILLIPGVLIYSNSPTKETLFLYPAIFFIVLECDYLFGKRKINLLNFFFKISYFISNVYCEG